MTPFDTAIQHINQGTTYSWDLTVLVGLGIDISAHLKTMLLQGNTSTEDAALVISLHIRNQLLQQTDVPEIQQQ